MLQQTTFTAAFVSLIVSVSTALFGYTAENGNANGVQETNESSPLISAAQLHELLGSEGSENIVVIDLGPERETFDKAHIKGAQFVDWVKDITDMDQPNLYKLVDQAGMQKLLRRLGITEQSKIVVYDDMNTRIAVRMYWSLKYYGIHDVQVLDGGRPAWFAADLPVTKDVVQVTASQFEIKTTNEKIAANLDFIADRLQNPDVSLVDGRPKSQFDGDEPGKVFHTGALHNKKGHIPGAINILWKDNFNRDGTFKSRDELEKLYESVTGSDMVVTYCNEGLHAAPPWFVLSEMLGHGDVRVYDNSLSEWANTDQPVELTEKQDDK